MANKPKFLSLDNQSFAGMKVNANLIEIFYKQDHIGLYALPYDILLKMNNSNFVARIGYKTKEERDSRYDEIIKHLEII